MPIFDFHCSKCKTTTERLTKSDVKMIECPQCGYLATKQVSAPGGFSLQGEGFYKPSPKPVDGAV